jgi:hypothetical protein
MYPLRLAAATVNMALRCGPKAHAGAMRARGD